MTSRELKDLNKFNETMGYGSARGARRSARTNNADVNDNDDDDEFDMTDYCQKVANEEEEDEQMMEETRATTTAAPAAGETRIHWSGLDH